MEPGKIPEGLPESAQKEINSTIKRQKLISEIEHELRTDQRYKAYFNQYHPTSIELFINYYKYQKASWIEFGEMYTQMEERRVLKYTEIA